MASDEDSPGRSGGRDEQRGDEYDSPRDRSPPKDVEEQDANGHSDRRDESPRRADSDAGDGGRGADDAEEPPRRSKSADIEEEPVKMETEDKELDRGADRDEFRGKSLSPDRGRGRDRSRGERERDRSLDHDRPRERSGSLDRSRERERDRDRRRSRSRDRGARRRSRSRSRSRDRGGRDRDYYRPRSRERRRSPPGRGGPSRGGGAPAPKELTMFVAGLAPTVREQEIDDMFSRYGRVTEIRIVRDPINGRCKGFGFVAMATDNQVSACVRELHGTRDRGGYKMVVERAKTNKF